MKQKKNMRYTRRSYKRKLVIFGVSIFMSLALCATGFAAWVISKDTNKTADGEVQIGAVTEASVEISDIKFVKDRTNLEDDGPVNFVFEPKADDTTGRVRADRDNNTPSENMNVLFTWSIKNYQIVSDVYVDFKIPLSVYEAIENKWITLPSEFEIQPGTVKIPDTEEGKEYKIARYKIQYTDADGQLVRITDSGETNDKIVSYTVQYSETDPTVIDNVTFVMEIKFGWGQVFNGLNPGIYYDTPYENDLEKGKGVSYEDLKATLNEFKATLHGIEYNATFEGYSEAKKAEEYEKNPIPTYFIEINATVA